MLKAALTFASTLFALIVLESLERYPALLEY